MKSHRIKSLSCLIALVFFASLAVAASNPTQVMAEMLMGINHFPSAEQKATLEAISQSESSSPAEKTIANAIHHLEHKAKPDDVAALSKIAAEKGTNEAEKALANIVMGFNHKVDAAAKEQLQAIAN